MSNAALSWAWRVPVSSTCKLVLVCLADRADDSGACFPSLRDIIERTGLSERAVRMALAALERSGVLRRDLRVNRSTVYRLQIEHAGSGGAPDAPGAQDAPQRGTTCPTPPAPHAPGGAPDAPITLTEPSEEPSGEPVPRTRPAPDADDPASQAPSMRTTLFREGVPILRAMLGKSDGACRALMGKLLRDMDDDCAALYQAIREAESLRPADPAAWLNAAARARGGHKGRHDRRGKTGWIYDEMAGRPGKLAALYAVHGAPPTINGTATADDDGAF